MIGVVILNYNSLKDTLKCIDSLARQEDVQLDIIVVDNASSSTNDIALLQESCKARGILFHSAMNNLGYNAGNNIGMRIALDAGCEAILIANPDMEFPDTRYVATLYREMMLHKDCAAISGSIISPEGRHQTPMKRDDSWTGGFAWIKDLFGLKKKTSAEYADFIDNPTVSHQCGKLSGCCLMLKSNYLLTNGLFDENLFLYCEESVLSRQIERAGQTMYYTADTYAVHRHVSNEKGDPRSRFRHWLNSRLYFISKYSGWPWYGRLIASMSFRLYTFVMITAKSLHR